MTRIDIDKFNVRWDMKVTLYRLGLHKLSGRYANY